jgi:hypothetical protein
MASPTSVLVGELTEGDGLPPRHPEAGEMENLIEKPPIWRSLGLGRQWRPVEE